MKAVKPSFVSSDANTAPNSLFVISIRVSSDSVADASTILRLAQTANGAALQTLSLIHI